MHGVSGTGKSTVAATLASEFNAIRIRSDVERKRLFGLAPDARSEDEEKLQLYSEAASIKTFAALETLAKTLLNLGYPVLVDATFIAARWRRLFQQLANVLQLPFVILDCQATQATILQRLALRQATRHDASEADTDVMRRQLASVEPFLPEEQMQVLVIDTEQTVNAGALRKFLEKSR
jgi:predicted kinase